MYLSKQGKIDFLFLNKNDSYIKNTAETIRLYDFNKNVIKHAGPSGSHYLDLTDPWAY